jgi:hypothetical protein
MGPRKIKPKAWNRGTAVHLGGSRVRFIWPCGCKHSETMKNPDKSLMAESAVAMFVKNWRANGVVLERCTKHPNWYSPKDQVQKLNQENPQEVIHART